MELSWKTIQKFRLAHSKAALHLMKQSFLCRWLYFWSSCHGYLFITRLISRCWFRFLKQFPNHISEKQSLYATREPTGWIEYLRRNWTHEVGIHGSAMEAHQVTPGPSHSLVWSLLSRGYGGREDNNVISCSRSPLERRRYKLIINFNLFWPR